ncbi:Phosphoglycolate phosphatase (PGPase)-like protein [Chara braunii]|uniref:Phosphoglycolate phosphatase (PGPase)-like protein n=1 Tax=Chara braunii TaxID=69332 RepID=A0A388KYF9_CHABU|nr:Phosphoglycolate phosphatase (PGPase)-like protein [Chara braunii]|eukprot:GBG75089.1 Phosphoglycolate phosphatase (PGPase)-like protein [Chara braunii]
MVRVAMASGCAARLLSPGAAVGGALRAGVHARSSASRAHLGCSGAVFFSPLRAQLKVPAHFTASRLNTAGCSTAPRRTGVVAMSGADSPLLEDAASLIDSVETFIFDCDGVIWKGDKLIEGVPETLDFLRAKGKRLVFVTNNSTKSRKQYGKKFSSLGLEVGEEEIFSSSFAAAAYLQSIKFDKKVYVIGEVGILEEFDLAGIEYIGGPADASKAIDLSPGVLLEHDHDVGAVVVGFDRYINYYKIQFGIKKSQICMVGDRLDTDILFGQAGGCQTLLVLSGVTTLAELQSPSNTIQPGQYTDKLADLLRAKQTTASVSA